MKLSKAEKENLKVRIAKQTFRPGRSPACWIWEGSIVRSKNGTPYGYLQLGKVRCTLRRLVWELYGGEPANDYIIANTCGESLCINPRHLYLSSRKKSGGRPKEKV